MSHWRPTGNFSDNSQTSSSDFLASTGTANTEDKQSPILTPASLTGADPPLTWHTLRSFLPIFELLGPKFVLDQDAYYIHGSLDDHDMQNLWAYSSLVTEFILTDGVDLKNVEPIIAPSTLFHIALFLEPSKSGILPSLLCLRIIQADKCFAYLHLLHTSSLKTLEAIDVPDHQHPTFYSFLTTLVHKAPLLEDVILGGPGKFPLKSLQAILQFTNLHRLELRDAASTISFTFLQDVGALPNLESFILDARSCKYIARIPEEKPDTALAKHAEAGSQTTKPSPDIDPSQTVCSPYLGSPIHEATAMADSNCEQLVDPDPTEVMTQTPKPSSDIDSGGLSWGLFGSSSSSCPVSPILDTTDDEGVDHPFPSIDNQIPCDTDSSTLAGGFHQLKKFHYIGELLLIQDVIPLIASSTLEDISITFIRPSHEDLTREIKIEVENVGLAETKERRRKADEETQQRIADMESLMKAHGPRVSRERRAILAEAETRWQKQEALYQEFRKADRVQIRMQATFDLHTALYITVLQTVSSKWSADLMTVRLNQLGRSSQPLSILPTLPKRVYALLFSYPKIKTLELQQWKLDSVEDFLSSLKLSNPKNLKQLHLPIDDPDSAISLSGLLDIAEACPMLGSLQCCINTLSPIPQYSVPTTKALAHGLQTLSVQNNPASIWDFNQQLLVARHLYLAFPRIENIEIVEGPNAEQWVRIRDLIKIYQVIREDDVYRFF